MRSTLILLIILLTAGSIVAQEADEGIPGTVYGTTNVRSGPDPRFEIVGQLQENDRVLIDGRESAANRWLHVMLTERTQGWIPSFMVIPEGDISTLPILEMLVEEGAGVLVIAYGRVNVRSTPGIDGEIVGQLDVGDEAAVVARSSVRSDWLMIRFGNAQEGWVAYFTVTVTGDPTDLPILVPDSSGEGLIPPSVLVRTLFNARLHTESNLASPLVMIVPFNAEVTPIARSERGDWLYVGYAGVEGWGVARLFEISATEISRLPVSTIIEATPEATEVP